MQTKTMLMAALLAATLQTTAQEQKPAEAPRQETLFNHARLRGGFGGPIFSITRANGKTGYGAGGGGGLAFDRFFIGAFGMGETFDHPLSRNEHLVLGYGGLWMGYCVPAHKVAHLYTSLKLGGGSTAVTRFDYDDWDFQDNWYDVAFVAVPEAGVELNIARWMRLSGSVGYRIVGGFEGWNGYGKNDLNGATYNLTLRFGWFGR